MLKRQFESLVEIIDNMDINTFIHSYITRFNETRNIRNFKENRIILHTNRIKRLQRDY